jgi:hypothetical protein
VNPKSLYRLLVAGALSLFAVQSSFAQGTAFVYQGQLASGGTAATGVYDFQFQAFNAVTNGSAMSGSITNFSVPVSNGLFTTTLDFGPGVFTGANLWLGIAVRTNGAVPFTPLFPRQPILPVPYAIFATAASNLLGTLPSSAFSGGYTNSVALTNGANLFTGSFSGNGGAVTNVNVTNLTGVLADSQLPVNTAFLNSNQTFTASNTFNGANIFSNLYGNSFSGSFFGNGLVGWIVVPGTNAQASIDHGYLLTNSQVVTVTLPASANAGDIVRIAGAGATGWEVAQNTGQSILGNFITYGKSWTKNQTLENWNHIACSSDGTKMAATGYGEGIWLSVNSGGTWSQSPAIAAQYEGVACSADGTILAAVVTNGGSIYISTNSGSTWAPLAGTAGNWSSVAASSSGGQFVAADSGVGIYTFTTSALLLGATSGNNWSSVASSANGSNLVATAYGGSIYVSYNAGVSWSPASSTSGFNWKAVTESADGTKMAAAVYGGGIYTSFNSGTNWAATAAPSGNWVSIASSSDDSKLVAVVSGGDIYTSANWGQTWTPQTNGVPTGVSWDCAASSSSGSVLAAGIYSTLSGGIFASTAAAQTTTTTGTNGYISGSQGSAAELQCIGTNQFMPVSFSGTIWGN